MFQSVSPRRYKWSLKPVSDVISFCITSKRCFLHLSVQKPSTIQLWKILSPQLVDILHLPALCCSFSPNDIWLLKKKTHYSNAFINIYGEGGQWKFSFFFFLLVVIIQLNDNQTWGIQREIGNQSAEKIKISPVKISQIKCRWRHAARHAKHILLLQHSETIFLCFNETVSTSEGSFCWGQ